MYYSHIYIILYGKINVSVKEPEKKPKKAKHYGDELWVSGGVNRSKSIRAGAIVHSIVWPLRTYSFTVCSSPCFTLTIAARILAPCLTLACGFPFIRRTSTRRCLLPK